MHCRLQLLTGCLGCRLHYNSVSAVRYLVFIILFNGDVCMTWFDEHTLGRMLRAALTDRQTDRGPCGSAVKSVEAAKVEAAKVADKLSCTWHCNTPKPCHSLNPSVTLGFLPMLLL